MVFGYYKRLTVSQRRVYDRSDKEASVGIPFASELHPLVANIELALKKEDRGETALFSQKLISEIAVRLRTPPVRVRVLALRPSNSGGELYGLYNPSEKSSAVISVWMRTARQKRVVAFRTFLRTLLHELCHHLDYEYFKFPYTFHTEGFYKRESSLFHQLVPERKR